MLIWHGQSLPCTRGSNIGLNMEDAALEPNTLFLLACYSRALLLFRNSAHPQSHLLARFHLLREAAIQRHHASSPLFLSSKDPHHEAAAASPLTSAASESGSIRTLSSSAETGNGGFDAGSSGSSSNAGAINLSVDRQQQDNRTGVLNSESSECLLQDSLLPSIWYSI